jgi:hypothetical protein
MTMFEPDAGDSNQNKMYRFFSDQMFKTDNFGPIWASAKTFNPVSVYESENPSNWLMNGRPPLIWYQLTTVTTTTSWLCGHFVVFIWAL